MYYYDKASGQTNRLHCLICMAGKNPPTWHRKALEAQFTCPLVKLAEASLSLDVDPSRLEFCHLDGHYCTLVTLVA